MDNLSKLAILLIAEGNVRKHHGYEVQFTNTDQALKNYFEDLVRELGFKVLVKSDKQLVVYSKELALKLFRLSPSFRSKPRKSGGQHACSLNCGCSISNSIMIDGIEYAPSTFPEAAFLEPSTALRLFFSCEGGVVLSRGGNEVVLRVCHPILKEQVKQMLDSIEIGFTERGNGLISIKRKNELIQFSKKVGFVDGVKASRGNHKGMEKQVLLGSLIK